MQPSPPPPPSPSSEPAQESDFPADNEATEPTLELHLRETPTAWYVFEQAYFIVIAGLCLLLLSVAIAVYFLAPVLGEFGLY